MTGETGTLDRIAARLLEITAKHGAPVSIIGWSLGGMYARELARSHRASVRQLILLGSPFRFRAHLGDRSLLSSLLGPAKIAKLELGDLRLDEHQRPAIDVPVTCIYSRTDGIVSWPACAESPGPRRENIEITGSHLGMTNNPAALIAIVGSTGAAGWPVEEVCIATGDIVAVSGAALLDAGPREYQEP